VAAAAVFVGCWVVLHHWFYADHQIIDTPIYEGYGNAIDHGLFPYRDFPVEYPPGALPIFVAPVYAYGYAGYADVFGWLMAAFGLGCLLVATVAGAGIRALAFIAVSPLLIGSMALSRYDLWPTLFVICALAALLHDRHRLGWLALGAAVVAKGFALAFVPVALVWTLRRRGPRELGYGVGLGMAVVLAAVLPFAILAPKGLWHSVSGQFSRPLQIESLAASLLTTFSHPHVISTHGSLNLGGEGWVAALTSVVEIAALVALWVAFARGPAVGDRFVRYVVACLCAFVALGKVLSPQFLIWLVPLVPLVRGLRGIAACVLLAGALIMTQVYFPQRYWEYIFHLHLAWVVLVRNLLLVALLATVSLPARVSARSS
jgi:Glycosyltransferase family 87